MECDRKMGILHLIPNLIVEGFTHIGGRYGTWSMRLNMPSNIAANSRLAKIERASSQCSWMGSQRFRLMNMDAVVR